MQRRRHRRDQQALAVQRADVAQPEQDAARPGTAPRRRTARRRGSSFSGSSVWASTFFEPSATRRPRPSAAGGGRSRSRAPSCSARVRARPRSAGARPPARRRRSRPTTAPPTARAPAAAATSSAAPRSVPCGADAGGHDRLTENQDDHQPVALGEVGRDAGGSSRRRGRRRSSRWRWPRRRSRPERRRRTGAAASTSADATPTVGASASAARRTVTSLACRSANSSTWATRTTT